MLAHITPVVLTYNEEPNIERVLRALAWANDIVVVDSYSADDTLSLVSKFSQVRLFQRKFDSLECQWNYALEHTGISTEWVFALDADYVPTPELLEEIGNLRPSAEVNGYRVQFRYCIYGERLRGSVYPPVVVLYRRAYARYRQDGHAHRVLVSGRIEDLRERILHDDRKSLTRWLASQNIYMQQEVEKLLAAERRNLTLPDRVRTMKFLAPFVIFLHCMIAKRGLFDGNKGLYYALQRMLAETLLSIYLLENDLTQRESSTETPDEIPRAAGSAANP